MQRVLTVCLILLAGVSVAFSQTLVLEPYGVSPADVKADTVGDENYLGIKDRLYTGLRNVGVESKVYLIATFEDSSLTALVWDLYEKPDGSAAALAGPTTVDEASEIATFIADLAGTYRVSITEGTYADTIVINATNYEGAQSAGLNCTTCHSGVFSTYQNTGHATALDEGLNGEKGSYFASRCVSCHSTGYDTDANNDGFDDFEFVFPDTLFPGVADSMYQEFPDAMARANIQCESCHGPGEEHIENSGDRVGDSRMVSSIQPEACAVCHDDDHYHVYPSQWEISKHANPDAEYTRARCAACHNGQGFIEFVDGGKTGLDEDIDANYDITCAACHDPHDATNENQLRTVQATLGDGTEVTSGGKGALCMNCHKSRRDGNDYVDNYLDNLSSHFGPHHGPQADILMGQNVPTFATEALPGPSHYGGPLADGCVNCHMYEEGDHGEHDEVGNLTTAGMHSFSMVSQQGEDNIAACYCHGDFGTSFDDLKTGDHDGNGVEEGFQTEVHGLLDSLLKYIPHDEEGHPVIEDSSVTADEAKAAYIYLMAYEDGSFGAHNPKFTVALLQNTIEYMKGVASSVETAAFSPVEYELSQNYPNPFNPTTQISYSIKKAGKVEIRVYDLLGREVATLVNEEMTPGQYKVEFDGGNLASGIYVYRIVAGAEFTAVKKMVLIK